MLKKIWQKFKNLHINSPIQKDEKMKSGIYPLKLSTKQSPNFVGQQSSVNSETEKIVWYKKINWWLTVVLILIIMAHSINLFGFPSYREDEGTYASQAWSVIHMGQLAPYTYWYDHAPAGWLFIALWNVLTGDSFIAGLSVNSARIFMVIINVLSAYILYKITFNITKKNNLALVAALIFALVPVGIIFQRRVYLDNIMTFWFLLSFYFLTKRVTLTSGMAGGFALMMAILTKESAIAFLPALIFIMIRNTQTDNRKFVIILWLMSFAAVAFYPFGALLKGEFFPTGSTFGGQYPHVSLLDALKFQTQRTEANVFFLQENSSFMIALSNTWQRYGLSFIIFGFVASIINLFLYKNKWNFAVSLLSLSYIIFTIRGLLLDWYIIPQIPLFALNIALLISIIFSKINLYKNRLRPIFQYSLLVTILVITVAFPLYENRHIFTLKQTDNQVAAVAWVEKNIKNKGITLIDNYAFLDLNPDLKDITKTNIHYYWKIDTDPQIKFDLLNNTWNAIDYLLFTPAMAVSIENDNLSLVNQAYSQSIVIKRFSENDVLNEGYPVEIRAVNNTNGPISKSWQWYKDNYIDDHGRVRTNAPKSNTISITSEGQSYAMLRAVWMVDQINFDKIWQWTKNNLTRDEDNLFHWLANVDTNDNLQIVDQNSASDADEDIALALLFAYQEWHDPVYLSDAQKIIRDIWNKEVIVINERYWLISGVEATTTVGHLINPSYFSPASYRIFAEVDKDHPWSELANDTYSNLEEIKNNSIFANKNSLVPNWLLLSNDGQISTATGFVNYQANDFGYDAFRLMWRLALDKLWFENETADAFLQRATIFYKKQLAENNRIDSIYTTTGKPVSNYPDLSTDAGALSAFFVTDQQSAIGLFSNRFWPAYDNGKWGDENNYYNQNWAWFAVALYGNNLQNLWPLTSTQNLTLLVDH
ncbi:MAG: glycosyl hydrolase family 8 [Candidatus Magasanikiibacteriota bacterium]